MILGKCIYNILTNDTDVSAVISTKVFPALAIEDIAYPYITYTQNSHSFSDAKCGKSTLDIIEYSIELHSETLTELNDLGIKTRNALDRYKGTIEGLEIQSVKYVSEDISYNDEDRVYIKTQTYSFRYLTLYGTLSKPTNLSVAYVSITELDLTWTDTNTGETGYEVWHSNNSTYWTLVTTEAANSTSYSDSGLNKEQVHYYKVRATDGTNGGEWSDVAGGYTAAPGITPSGIAYQRQYETLQRTSYALYDEAWQLANGGYDYTPPTNPEYIQELDLVTDNTGYTLLNNNAFGNKFRFTFGDGTEATNAATTQYVIDHLTGLGWLDSTANSFNTSWTNSFGASGTLKGFNDANQSGYNDWFHPNITMLSRVMSYERELGYTFMMLPRARTVLFQYGNSNTYTNSDYFYRYRNLGYIDTVLKTIVSSFLLTRIHYK